MADKVVDASAVAALIFAEPAQTQVVKMLEASILHAPDLLPYEMANIYFKKCRLHPEKAMAFRDRFAEYAFMDIRLVAMDPLQVADLASETGLSAYDASYLLLSRRMKIPLVTLDKRLNAQAKG